MRTFSGFLCILLTKTLYKVMHGYTYWFSMQVTGENTVNSYAWVHLMRLSMHITGENTVESYAWVHLVWLSMHITD